MSGAANPDPLAVLGRRIQEQRVALGLSQVELASRAKMHRTYLGGLERGKRNPTVATLLRLATALGCEHLGELLDGLAVPPP